MKENEGQTIFDQDYSEKTPVHPGKASQLDIAIENGKNETFAEDMPEVPYEAQIPTEYPRLI